VPITADTLLHHLLKLGGLAFLVVAGAVGIYVYQARFSAQQEIERLEHRNEQLAAVVERLGAARRVAEILVTEQREVGGVLHTTLLFVESARDGSTLPPKSFTIEGTSAHLDAMVIKFERDFVKENDPLRGRSIALFTRLYGDRQAPTDGFRLDEPGKIPDAYRGADPRVTQFERELWQNFWRLADDATYREQFGVRVASGEGVWHEAFRADRLYTVTLDADGGLNLQSEPLKGIYREALKARGPT
jgi:hypothetical protein